MLSTDSLTEIIEKSYQDFHLVRSEVTIDRFRMKRIIPILVDHIQKHYRKLLAKEVIEALASGISGIYDDQWNRTKSYDLPTFNRWLKTYSDNNIVASKRLNYSIKKEYTDEEIKGIKKIRQAYKTNKKEAKIKSTNSTGDRLRKVLGNPIGETLKLKIQEIKPKGGRIRNERTKRND